MIHQRLITRIKSSSFQVYDNLSDSILENDKKTANVEDEKEESSNSHHPVFIIDDHDEISEDKSSKPSKDGNPVNISEQIEEEKPSLHHGDLTRFPSVQSENVDVPAPSDAAVEITREDIKGKLKEMSGRDRNYSQLSIGSNMQASSIISCDAGRDDVSIATPSIIVPNAFANDNWDLWEAVKYNKVDEVSSVNAIIY